MYERTLDGEVLDLGHEGILYENSFIFYDKKTGSLWVHVTATAIKGPMRGKSLKIFPSTVTSWAAWRKQYPETLVLEGRRRDGFMGTFTGMDQKALESLGLAVFHRGETRLYPFSVLEKNPVLEDELGGEGVVIVFSRASGVARAFVRTVEDESLSFEVLDAESDAELLLKDTATDSVWDGLSGIATEGAFEGESLPLLVAYAILRDRYPVFHTKGTVYGQQEKGQD